jgi:anti-sigma factor RsiW
MSNLFDNTILGAYVDGELSAEQAEAVERLLAVNVEAQQTVASIREITVLLRAAAFQGMFPEYPWRLAS